MLIPVCEVPAGVYPIGDDRLPDSRPAHTVELAAFSIGRTTVTNAQFMAFVTVAEGYTNQSFWSEAGWRWLLHKQVTHPAFWHDPNFNRPDQPVVGVCWYEAEAFACWLKLETDQTWRLPTEAEWEAAARGLEGTLPQPPSSNTAERRIGYPWAVTQPGNLSWCGAADLCGNVWEWCSSRWGRNWQVLDYRYPYQPDDGREDQTGSFARVMRGGSWFDAATESHPANRGRYLPGSRGSNIGFRVAHSEAVIVPPAEELEAVVEPLPVFRLASADDVPAFLPLMRDYYAYDGFSFEEAKATRALTDLLTNPAYGLAWLIEIEGELAGYIAICFGYSLEFGGRDAFVDELYLKEAYRGRGFGRQAVEHTIAACREQRIQALHLEVMADNDRAISLYRRMGFEYRGGTMMSRVI